VITGKRGCIGRKGAKSQNDGTEGNNCGARVDEGDELGCVGDLCDREECYFK